MHETAWVGELIRRVESIARREGAARVVGVTVRLGPWSSLSPAYVCERFCEATRGTIADGARLAITTGVDGVGLAEQGAALESIEIET